MRQQTDDAYEWIVREVREETPSVRSFLIESLGERPEFISGQYLTVHLPIFLPVEGKSYSISSGDSEKLLRITVKVAGPFSQALYAHKVGDKLETGAPYGFFYPEEGAVRDLVFIAGGIGITPCMSIIESLNTVAYPKNITLFYSNRTVSDIAFNERLTTLETLFSKFRIIHHITRQDACDTPYKRGRMTGAEIVTSLPHAQSASDYFICGSIDFTKNMWKELKEAGVPSTQIYTEGFY